MEQAKSNKKNNTDKNKTKTVRKVINISLWVCFLSVLLIVFATFIAIEKGLIGYMPPVEQLENPIEIGRAHV